jgi:hypothetical protein
MWNNRTSRQDQTRSSNPRRWLALCVIAGALLPAFGAAQTVDGPIVTILKSGLQTIFGGNYFLALVTEVGPQSAASEVTIEFRDASDRRRAFTVDTLTRTHPVRLRFAPPAGTGADQFRVVVKHTPLTPGYTSEPIVGLEDVNPNSLQVVPKVICAIGPSVPPGAEGNCDDWRVNRLTVEQANNLPD